MLRTMLVLLALFAVSASAMETYTFTMPAASEIQAKKAQGLRLIALQEWEDSPVSLQWMTEAQISHLPAVGRKTHFVDVTEHDAELASRPVVQTASIPSAPKHQSLVKDVISRHLCKTGNCHDEIIRVDTHLSSYHTRYYTQPTAKQAAEWLKAQYEQVAGSRLGRDIHISFFEHRWLQPSIIIRMDGVSRPQETVIIGGHIDSTVGNPTARSPGSDDDASGSSTVFAAFKALVEAGFKPDRTVEFHAYAAEEAGLLGSQDVAKEWKRQARNVVSMVQFDMTGYSKQRTIGLIRDNTNNQLTDLIAKLIQTYTDVKGQDSRCGYGCSDHASWNTQGYPAAFPFEAPFGSHSPYIHTVNDVLANMDFEYMGNFGKLAIAYVIEVAKL